MAPALVPRKRPLALADVSSTTAREYQPAPARESTTARPCSAPRQRRHTSRSAVIPSSVRAPQRGSRAPFRFRRSPEASAHATAVLPTPLARRLGVPAPRCDGRAQRVSAYTITLTPNFVLSTARN